MINDDLYVKAVESLKKMDDDSLGMAEMLCRMGFMAAEENLDKGENKVIAIEMLAMSGEAAKEMVRRIFARGDKLPNGDTEKEACDKVDQGIADGIKELEAA